MTMLHCRTTMGTPRTGEQTTLGSSLHSEQSPGDDLAAAPSSDTQGSVGQSEALEVALVARMARGDRQALGELFQLHAPRLLPIALAILSNSSEAEDVLHDVFLEAWRKAQAFDAERGTVRTWLAVRLRSRCLDRKRSDAARRHVLEAGRSEAASKEQVNMPPVVEYSRLALAVGELSSEHRDVLTLGYIHDLSCSEIGEQLGVPVGTVKSRVRRALSCLRHALAGEGSEEPKP